MSGLILIDEVLSNSAIASIQGKMVQGVDMTTLCNSVGGSGCSSCSAGKYKIDPGPIPCTDCSVNKYSTDTAAIANTTCQNCPANTVSASGSGVLTACTCNLGYTTLVGDGNACDACVPGAYKTATGSQACTLCDLGKYSGAVALTTATCISCDTNQMTNGTGKDELADCRCNAGFTGPDGTHCYECDAGKYKSATGDATCTSCPQDRYSTTLQAISGATCLTCPSSSQAPQGSSAKAACICNMGYTGPGGSAAPYTCTACVAGTFKISNGSAACTNCLPDTYSTVGAATSNLCLGCPRYMQSPLASDHVTDCMCNAGYTGSNGVLCTGCVAGKYKTTVGTALCDNCPVNEFSISVNKTDSVCTTCLSVTSQPSQSLAGSAMATDCKCNKGYTGNDGQTCTGCIPGKYKTAAGSVSCSSCLEDTYQPFAGMFLQSDCEKCPSNATSLSASPTLVSCQCLPGFSGANGLPCTQCYAGQFKQSKGPQACSVCPNATWSSHFAATSNGTCTQCPAYSLSRAGSTALTDCKCDKGYFTKDMLLPNVSCSRCTPGTYNSELHSIACSKCTAGQYSTNFTATSSETCKTCMIGYSAEGRSQCEMCPANAIALPGSGVLEDCKCVPGYTGPNGGTCQYCIAGKYKPNNGSALCTNCPPDTYSDETARALESDCIDCYNNAESLSGSNSFDLCKCSVGYTSSVLGQDGYQCTPCGLGLYKNTTGYAACSKCPRNTYRDVTTSTSITDCTKCFNYSESGEGSVDLNNCLCVGGFERAIR